jgi:hypothetical protein
MGKVIPSHLPPAPRRALRLARRAQALAGNLLAINKNPGRADIDYLKQHNTSITNKLISELQYSQQTDEDIELATRLEGTLTAEIPSHQIMFKFKFHSAIFSKTVDLLMTNESQERRAVRRQALSSPAQGFKAAYNSIRPPTIPSLQYVTMPTYSDSGHINGHRLTSSPTEVEAAARDVWGAIYKGNVASPIEQTRLFFNKYNKYTLCKANEFKIQPITAEKFKAACTRAKHSAAGPDSWAPRDMALFSNGAFSAIARLLNTIEDGAQWPQDALHAKSVFFTKGSPPCRRPPRLQTFTHPPHSLSPLGHDAHQGRHAMD